MEDLTAPTVLVFLFGMATAFGIAIFVHFRATMRHETALADARHEGEARLQDFAEVSSDWFWEMDAELRFTRFSGHMLETLGFEGEVYIGRTRREIAADFADDARWQNHLAMLDNHLPFQDFRYDLQLPDGRTLLISISGRPVFDRDGVFLGYRGTGRDLTAETRMRTALGASEERLRAIADNSPWSMFMTDLNGRYVLRNRTFLEWTRMDPMQEEGPIPGFETDTEEATRRHNEQVMETQELVQEERRVTYPDGVTRDVLVLMFPVFDTGGQLTGIAGINLDLTARKKAETALREMQARLDAVVGNLPVAVYRVVRAPDQTLSFPYLSAGIRKFVGFEADEIKRNPALMRTTIHPDDVERLDANVKKAAADMTPLDCAYRRVRPSGETHWVRTMSRPHKNPAGEIIWDGVMVDITEQVTAEQGRQRLEETMATALESLQEGFALFDRNDRLVVANEEYHHIIPVARDILDARGTFEDLLRAVVAAGIVDLGGQDPDAYIAWRLEAHENPGDPHVLKCGAERWYMSKEARLSDGGTALTVVDISPLKLAEGAARMAKEEAEFASRSKSEFLANMSHELRTPLNSVIGMSDVIMNETFGGLQNPTYRDYAADINASGRHLLSVITDILDIARIEAGEILLEESDTDLGDVLADCERMVRERADQANLDLDVRIAEDARHLFADTRRLRQIILNLLSNAIKFTPPGGRIDVRTAIAADGALLIHVADTGIGIDAEDVPRILEPFRQVEDIMTRPHEGSGLGLSLVKLLMEAHGGELHIESRLGEGTSANLTFPLSRVRRIPANDSAPMRTQSLNGQD